MGIAKLQSRHEAPLTARESDSPRRLLSPTPLAVAISPHLMDDEGVKTWLTRDRLEQAAVLSYVAFAATAIASLWEAGWPGEHVRAQGWAIAIALPAFLLGMVFQAAAALGDPVDEDTSGTAAG